MEIREVTNEKGQEFPTAEQEGKAKLSAILLMMISGIPCVICIITRIKYRRSANKETTSDGCVKR